MNTTYFAPYSGGEKPQFFLVTGIMIRRMSWLWYRPADRGKLQQSAFEGITGQIKPGGTPWTGKSRPQTAKSQKVLRIALYVCKK